MTDKRSKKDRDLAELVPVICESITWDIDTEGLVVVHVENKGIMKRLTQLILKKPKVSHIHLDEIGSYVWRHIDAQSTVAEIAVGFEQHFGERVQPTYERLGQYFSTLVSCGFVRWSEESGLPAEKTED